MRDRVLAWAAENSAPRGPGHFESDESSNAVAAILLTDIAAECQPPACPDVEDIVVEYQYTVATCSICGTTWHPTGDDSCPFCPEEPDA